MYCPLNSLSRNEPCIIEFYLSPAESSFFDGVIVFGWELRWRDLNKYNPVSERFFFLFPFF